ncbi:hypothetical protein THOM_0932 [Trachipleistophora hominis]|uniref:Uncharacterized protein n=1 Tax=Trachipleistophora hominis TaxID=72359 RepID=L7JZB1_TRAHO|nr:hypothetical protein THOM_0932 [Trachipleistophora hominis]
MVSEEELDPCLIIPFQHTTDSKVSYDISFFMNALKRLFKSICLFYNYEMPLCLKLSNEQVYGLAKHFWQILMEENKRLIQQFIPELFSLRKELDSRPGTFYPCELYQIITIIYSTSHLHHMLKCIDKYK